MYFYVKVRLGAQTMRHRHRSLVAGAAELSEEGPEAVVEGPGAQ